jgi:peptidoglycan/xylan/chitin deacetylase (PgdA/CDA1 family)
LIVPNLNLNNFTAKTPAFYRPYDGVSSEAIVRHMSAHGIKVVLWSLEPDRSASAASLLELAGKVRPGDVLRLHNSPATVEALPHLIDALQREFYEFLTIEQVHSYPDDSPK